MKSGIDRDIDENVESLKASVLELENRIQNTSYNGHNLHCKEK